MKSTTNTILTKGYGVASGKAEESPYPAGTIAMQRPLFRDLGLDLYSLHPATLNLSIAPKQMQVTRPKYTFRNVNWAEGFDAENFSFSECAIVFAGNTYSGFIYYPRPETKIGHFQSPSIVEVICQYIPNIHYGSVATLVYNKHEITIE